MSVKMWQFVTGEVYTGVLLEAYRRKFLDIMSEDTALLLFARLTQIEATS